MSGGLVTEPTHPDLMTLATPYALDAVTPAEFDDIERQLINAPELVARAFAEEVRAVRETMATVSASTAIEPPEHLRGRPAEFPQAAADLLFFSRFFDGFIRLFASLIDHFFGLFFGFL